MITETLGELCDIQIGRTPSRSESRYWGKGHKWVSISDLNSRNITETKEEITDAAINEIRCRKVHAGTLLFSFKLTIGKMAFAGTDLYTNEAIAALRVKDTTKLHAEFLFYALKVANYGVSNQAAKGKTLNSKSLAAIEIPLPPLEDQKRIAYLLSKVEGLIAQRKQHLQQLDVLLKSVFNDMFGEPESNPKHLPIKELGTFITHLTSGGRSWAKYYAQQGKRFIRSLDVQMNSIGDDDVVFVDPPDTTEAERTRVIDGDVLLTITGSKVGRVCFVPEGFEEAYVSQHVAIIRTTNINPIFLSYYLSMPLCGQRQIKKNQYGQAKPGLNLTQIRELTILEPPAEKQKLFARIVESVESLKLKYVETIEGLQTFYSGLSHQAFSGNLDLTRVNGELSEYVAAELARPVENISTPQPFELPSPTNGQKLKSLKSRKSALKSWLTAYCKHLGEQPFEANSFIALVQQKLSDLESESDIEWHSHEIGVAEYDEVKKWIFEELEAKRLKQDYNNKTNRVRVSAVKD